jgi:hypothetical protein
MKPLKTQLEETIKANPEIIVVTKQSIENSYMNCMVCGKQAGPKVPLCVCEDCRKNRASEVDKVRTEYMEYCKQNKIVKNQNAPKF